MPDAGMETALPFRDRDDRDRRTQRLLILTVRLLFVAFMIAVSILPFAGSLAASSKPFHLVVVDYLGPVIATMSFTAIIL
ncbi:MAG: hypothetical protein QF886_27445, partial [Planctomycetota bacterium]|nr:hypothetical protein [Planctomycetota bacterium]